MKHFLALLVALTLTLGACPAAWAEEAGEGIALYAVYTAETLPKIYIETENHLALDDESLISPDERKGMGGMLPAYEYVNAIVSVSDCEGFEIDGAEAQVKIRGNYTSSYPKKPLRIKFSEKQAMCGLNGGEALKNWVLLAEYKDASLLRNSAALYIANSLYSTTGNYASDFRNVEVYLNGEYNGLYVLAEQQQTGKTRVNVPEPKNPKKADPDTLTDEEAAALRDGHTGYFFEYDGYYTNEDPAETFSIRYDQVTRPGGQTFLPNSAGNDPDAAEGEGAGGSFGGQANPAGQSGGQGGENAQPANPWASSSDPAAPAEGNNEGSENAQPANLWASNGDPAAPAEGNNEGGENAQPANPWASNGDPAAPAEGNNEGGENNSSASPENGNAWASRGGNFDRGNSNGGNFNREDSSGGGFSMNRLTGFTIKSDIYFEEQRDFLQHALQTIWDVLWDAVYADHSDLSAHPYLTMDADGNCVPAPEIATAYDAVAAVVDVDSLIDMYILQEIAEDNDLSWSSFFFSLDMSPEGNHLLTYTAPWDFDSGFGYVGDNDGLFAMNSDNPWLVIFYDQGWFWQRVNARWDEAAAAGVFAGVLDMIDTLAQVHQEAYDRNLSRWPEGGSEMAWGGSYGGRNTPTHAQSAASLRAWLEERIRNLDQLIDQRAAVFP